MKSVMLLSIGTFWRTFLICHVLSSLCHHTISAHSCEGGQDVFATVKENSPMGEFIANITITGDPYTDHMNLTLSGNDADWFVLEGKTIMLNSSDTRVLDREVQGSVLMATVTCYEEEGIQNEHRITVEILNMNDNKPEFLQSTVQPVEISEFTAVNSTAFTVQAADADGDILVYSIDETSPDASYFRVDNTGRVILAKSLDYETKTQLHLLLYAVESNTTDHYNTTATLTVNVADGDDRYPQFQPCMLFSLNQSSWVCANPLYTANITEEDQDIVLDFAPGPVQAVDGDVGLRTPLTYTILSGADNGRFVIDSETGEVRLTRRVENRLLTPTLRLRIMAAQRDDPTKYSVATALVRVLAENRFPPQFGRSTYRGFVTESSSPASLVITYGSELLVLKATDRDFADGFNPKLQYSLSSESNISQFYYITQEGLLIAKANQLQPNHNHSLEVLATDLESGDVIKAVIDIDILQKGVPVPQGPLEEGHPHGSGTVGRAGGVAGICLILLAIALFVLIYCIKKRRDRHNPTQRASVAEGKHPNVVNQSRPLPLAEEASYHNEAFSGYDASTSNLHGKQGIYTKTDPADSSGKSQTSKVTLLSETIKPPPAGDAYQSVKSNGKAGDKSITKSVSFQDFVVVRECTDDGGGDSEAADSQAEECMDRSDVAGLEEINIDLVGISYYPDGFETETKESLTELVLNDKIITESERINTDLETTNTDIGKNNPDIANASSEKYRIKRLNSSDKTFTDGDIIANKNAGVSFPENKRCQTNQDSQEGIGQNIADLDLLEPLKVKMVILQDDWDSSTTNQTRPDRSERGSAEDAAAHNTASTDATKADSSAFSKAQSDKSSMISPDASNLQTEKTDVKCSNSEGPDTATSKSQRTNKSLVPSGTEVDNFQLGMTGEEEGNADIKIIVTLTDTDETNADSGDQDTSEGQNLNVTLNIPDAGEASMQHDNEDISTDLDNMSQDESLLAPFSSDLSKQAMNHSDLSHVVRNNSDTKI